MTKNSQYQQTRWTLEALFPAADSPAVDQAVQELEAATSYLEALRPQLSPQISGEAFAQAVQKIETFTVLISRLGSYGQLWFTEDTQNQAALAMMGRMEQLLTDLNNRILFFRLWWRSLDDAAAQRLLDYTGDARYSFEQDRLFKDYTLSEVEEQIINIKDVKNI